MASSTPPLPSQQKVIRLAHRPTSKIDPPSHFLPLTHEPIPTLTLTSSNKDNDNLVLVHRLYLSLDPAMRGWMSSAKSYLPPVPIGGVMRGATLSEVVAVSYNDNNDARNLGGNTRTRLRVGDVVSEFSN